MRRAIETTPELRLDGDEANARMQVFGFRGESGALAWAPSWQVRRDTTADVCVPVSYAKDQPRAIAFDRALARIDGFYAAYQSDLAFGGV
jgi:hypothetical protein